MRASDVDVVVVGSGAAGLSAALAARGEGARVLVAESESVIGGATRLSGGWVMAAGTDVQRAAQFDDRPDDLYHEYMLLNQYETQPALVRRISYDGASTIAWLSELGVHFVDLVQAWCSDAPPAAPPRPTH
jgi:succinate dehydrogenase/fumarate reductase flavoprotein subunit